MHYDYLIVGAGLFGAVFAHEMTKKGKKCLCIEKRNHIGGNIYTKKEKNINVHKYGAHIFHTNKKEIWEYINQFAEFNNYINSPVAIYKGTAYNLPFNMNTFCKLWDITTPAEAKEIIENQRLKIDKPKNLEECALSMVGTDIYEKLVKEYTEKQWGKECKELPTFIIKRLPLRFTFDNNYFNDNYQGIPIGGYTQIIEKLLENIPVKLNISYKEFIEKTTDTFDKILYTGMIDEFYDYKLGELEYRSLHFEEIYLKDCENYQGNAVVNYTEKNPLYTRIIEHKHFEKTNTTNTIITKEYPIKFEKNCEPYYPINDDKNNELYKKYHELAKKEKNIIFGGRLGMYRYLNMDEIIEIALNLVEKENYKENKNKN